MWYIAAAVAAVALAGVLAGNARTRAASDNARPVSAASLKKLSPGEINLLLSRLENEDPPEVVRGAMCYRVAGPPSVSEYTCPVCGEKTLYHNMHTRFIEYELETARRLAESIISSTDLMIEVDESLYCSYCSDASAEDACLMLRVTTSEGEELCNAVSVTDLRMLDSFLRGELFWVTATDDRMPLKDNADRLRRLLGLAEQ